MITRAEAKTEPTPAGKRTVRETAWGNTNAYVSGKFWKTIGPTYSVGVEEAAQRWLKGEDE